MSGESSIRKQSGAEYWKSESLVSSKYIQVYMRRVLTATRRISIVASLSPVSGGPQDLKTYYRLGGQYHIHIVTLSLRGSPALLIHIQRLPLMLSCVYVCSDIT